MTALQTLKTWAINWALSVLLAFAFLLLTAWLDGRPSETDALRLSTEISNDRAAEHVALKGAR